MALPVSGPLSFSSIAAALCTPDSTPYSLREMSSAAGFSTPDSVSEFYGYSCPNAYVEVSNETTDRTIENITIDSVSVTGDTFPIGPAGVGYFTTSQTGSGKTIVVTYTGTGFAYCQVIDSDGTTCSNAAGAGRTFTGQLVTSGDTIFVNMGDGACP